MWSRLVDWSYPTSEEKAQQPVTSVKSTSTVVEQMYLVGVRWSVSQIELKGSMMDKVFEPDPSRCVRNICVTPPAGRLCLLVGVSAQVLQETWESGSRKFFCFFVFWRVPCVANIESKMFWKLKSFKDGRIHKEVRVWRPASAADEAQGKDRAHGTAAGDSLSACLSAWTEYPL